MEFLKKVPKGQESHIKHVLDRQNFIDKKNGVKKPKTFQLPPEITNMIYNSIQKKLEQNKKASRGDKISKYQSMALNPSKNLGFIHHRQRRDSNIPDN